MKNITVAVPESTYIRARVWAAEHQTSISAVVAFLLRTLPETKRAAAQFPRQGEKPLTTSHQPLMTNQ
ncbi:MAG: hypothetical protein ABSA85_15015 [Terracidiphilus sp.]|jgi:hypothetical protein